MLRYRRVHILIPKPEEKLLIHLGVGGKIRGKGYVLNLECLFSINNMLHSVEA